MSTDDTLTTEDVSKILKVSTRTVREMRKKGTGPSYAIVGKVARYRREDIAEWLHARIVQAPQQ